MAGKYFLYTVTGERELHYAAVDWVTGRVWTSPTKDGANSQAREAGLDTCIEKATSKDELLRQMGIESGSKIARKPLRGDVARVDYDNNNSRASSSSISKGELNWFIPGIGDDEPRRVQKFTPRTLNSSNRSSRGRNKRFPFAVNEPIAPRASGEDVLIVPSPENLSSIPSPFSEKQMDQNKADE